MKCFIPLHAKQPMSQRRSMWPLPLNPSSGQTPSSSVYTDGRAWTLFEPYHIPSGYLPDGMPLRFCGTTYQSKAEQTVQLSPNSGTPPLTDAWHPSAQVRRICAAHAVFTSSLPAGNRKEEHVEGGPLLCRRSQENCPRHEVPCNPSYTPDSRCPRHPHSRQQQLHQKLLSYSLKKMCAGRSAPPAVPEARPAVSEARN